MKIKFNLRKYFLLLLLFFTLYNIKYFIRLSDLLIMLFSMLIILNKKKVPKIMLYIIFLLSYFWIHNIYFYFFNHNLYSLDGLMQFLLILLAFYLGIELSRIVDKNLIKMSFYILTSYFFISIFLFILGFRILNTDNYRFEGFLHLNPNGYSAFFIVLLIFLNEKFQKALSFMIILLTQSRTAFLLSAMIYYMKNHLTRRKISSYIFLLVPKLIIFFLIFISIAVIVANFINYENYKIDHLIWARLTQAYLIYKSNMLSIFGEGHYALLHNLSKFYIWYKDDLAQVKNVSPEQMQATLDTHNIDAHNIYLVILYDYGFAGLTILLNILLYFYHIAIKYNYKNFFLMVFIFSIYGMAHNCMFDRFFWFFLGLTYGLDKYKVRIN